MDRRYSFCQGIYQKTRKWKNQQENWGEYCYAEGIVTQKGKSRAVEEIPQDELHSVISPVSFAVLASLMLLLLWLIKVPITMCSTFRWGHGQARIQTGKLFLFRIHNRWMSSWKHDEIDRQVTNLIQHEKVKESSSPWSFPFVPPNKKNASQRLCMDHHKLNAVTVMVPSPCQKLMILFLFLSAHGGSQPWIFLATVTGKWQWTQTPIRRQHS